MTVNVRWVTVKGQQLLSVHLPPDRFITLDPNTAWELITELRWNLLVNSDPPPDDRTDGY